MKITKKYLRQIIQEEAVNIQGERVDEIFGGLGKKIKGMFSDGSQVDAMGFRITAKQLKRGLAAQQKLAKNIEWWTKLAEGEAPPERVGEGWDALRTPLMDFWGDYWKEYITDLEQQYTGYRTRGKGKKLRYDLSKSCAHGVHDIVDAQRHAVECKDTLHLQNLGDGEVLERYYNYLNDAMGGLDVRTAMADRPVAAEALRENHDRIAQKVEEQMVRRLRKKK